MKATPSFVALALALLLVGGVVAPSSALAAKGGEVMTVGTLSIQANVAPAKPSTSQISWRACDIYEYATVVRDGVPVGSVSTGKYLGVGLEVSLEGSDAVYYTVKAEKTKSTPSKPDEYADDWAYADEAYVTQKLEPSTTYYLYVATGNVKKGYGYSGTLWSDWSDPITVKTPAAKKSELKANPMTAKAKTVTFKHAKVKKKAQSVKAAKAFTVKKAKGKVTYKKTSGSKKITVSKAGKVTVKKGTKKGTYKVKVKVTAAGNATYKSGSKTVTLAVKVK